MERKERLRKRPKIGDYWQIGPGIRLRIIEGERGQEWEIDTQPGFCVEKISSGSIITIETSTAVGISEPAES